MKTICVAKLRGRVSGILQSTKGYIDWLLLEKENENVSTGGKIERRKLHKKLDKKFNVCLYTSFLRLIPYVSLISLLWSVFINDPDPFNLRWDPLLWLSIWDSFKNIYDESRLDTLLTN